MVKSSKRKIYTHEYEGKQIKLPNPHNERFKLKHVIAAEKRWKEAVE